MRAIVSVSNRDGLIGFCQSINKAGFEIVSTGGTGGVIANAGLPVTQVSDITGFPEILDGRVKPLHPKVHAGILARPDISGHLDQMAQHDISAFDLVAVNLYPFVKTVTEANVSLQDALENIDIGGPTLIRAAAKNFPHVIVVVDPVDYNWVGEQLANNRPISLNDRQRLAHKAFQHVALYDTAISKYLSTQDGYSDELTIGLSKVAELKYGENPHQSAALYTEILSAGGIVGAQKIHGGELSFNNVLDADSAWRIVSNFIQPAVAIIKHNNPCGLAIHDDQPTAYERAFTGDPTSAYGGIVGFNRPVTASTTKAMLGVMYDVIVAPDYEPEAIEFLSKRKNTRVIRIPNTGLPSGSLDVRPVSGGALVQEFDEINEDPGTWQVKTKNKPSVKQLDDLAFAWNTARYIKSNAIVLAHELTMVGMGTGQPNRVTSIHLALRIAGNKSKGSVLASDAFMPFADNIEMAASGGITAIAQPGGSIRDEEVIAAADELGLAMVFTGTRHFKH